MSRLLHASHSHLFVGARLWPDRDGNHGSAGPDDAGAVGDAEAGEDRVVFSDGSSAEADLTAEGKTQRLDVASYETQAGTVVAAKSWFCDERADAASGSTILLVTERAG